jgi:hypothetical protein
MTLRLDFGPHLNKIVQSYDALPRFKNIYYHGSLAYFLGTLDLFEKSDAKRKRVEKLFSKMLASSHV